MPTKDELRERLDELGAEQPASDANKAELEEAVAAAEAAKEESEQGFVVEEATSVERENEVALQQAQDEAAIKAEQEINEEGADPEEVSEAVEEARAEVDEDEVDPLPDRLASGPVEAVREPDYSNYPPPLGEREAQAGEAWESDLVYPQKSVLYTDGLSGRAEENLERAYEIPEVLQSSDEEEREAGDESNSSGLEAQKEESDDKE